MSLADARIGAQCLHLLAAVSLMVVATLPARAETVRVRSGEHADFTRIVLDLESQSDWQFGRVNGGYELRLAREGIDFDLTRVFALIPRDRLNDLVQTPEGSNLKLQTICDCHAEVVELASRALVIDLRDGPPPPGSEFERPLDVAGTNAAAAVPEDPVPPSAARRVNEMSEQERARLALYWGTSGASQTPDLRPAETPVVEPAEPGPGVIAQDAPVSLGNEAPEEVHESADLGHAAVEGEQHAAKDAHASGAHASAEHPGEGAAQPEADAERPPPGSPYDPRVAEAQEVLIRQLGRAASQGLLEVEAVELPEMPSTMVHAAEQAEVGNDAPVKPAATMAAPEVTEHIAVHAETSIDRDSLPDTPAPEVTDVGAPCLPDDALEIAGWGDDQEPALQISQRRQALIGEFDLPSGDAVTELARLYLFLGFGAEAREVLLAFDVEVEDLDVLLTLAAIMDQGSADEPGRLGTMADCDTSAALWAVLSRSNLKLGDPVDTHAVIRSFSRLPLHLRRHLGPLISERFLSVNDEGSARSIRDAITRAAGDHGAGVRVIDARLDLEHDKTAPAESGLLTVIAEDGPASAEALVLYVDVRLAQGVGIDTQTLDTAAAFAFEHRGTELGGRLARAQILGLAAAGEFDAAFETEASLKALGPEAAPAPLDEPIFAMLLQKADDATFLRHVFGSAEAIEQADLSRGLRQGLAGRLLDLGFAREARLALAIGPEANESDRMLTARAALAERDATAALAELAGLEGPEAANLRAEALTLLGAHSVAATVYAEAGQVDDQVKAAWRAGDLAAVATLGTPEQQAAVAELIRQTAARTDDAPATGDDPSGAPTPTPEPIGDAQPSGTAPPDPVGAPAQPLPTDPAALAVADSPTEGSLAGNRALLEQSQSTRQALTALLDAFPALAAPTP